MRSEGGGGELLKISQKGGGEGANLTFETEKQQKKNEKHMGI